MTLPINTDFHMIWPFGVGGYYPDPEPDPTPPLPRGLTIDEPIAGPMMDYLFPGPRPGMER